MKDNIPDKISASMRKRFNKYSTEKIDESITMKSVYSKYNGICQDCGIKTKCIHPPVKHGASIEHIIPLADGGNHTWDNVELICVGCNSKRNTTYQKAVYGD